MNDLAMQPLQEKETSTILQRIGKKDRTAINDCLDAYGDFVWTLTRKLTATLEEAELATQQIFTDIWRYCERPLNSHSAEKKVIATIALRRLFKGFNPPGSLTRVDLPN